MLIQMNKQLLSWGFDAWAPAWRPHIVAGGVVETYLNPVAMCAQSPIRSPTRYLKSEMDPEARAALGMMRIRNVVRNNRREHLLRLIVEFRQSMLANKVEGLEQRLWAHEYKRGWKSNNAMW